MDDKLKQFYEKLNQDGYKLPDYDTFYSGMQDQDTANKLHQKLTTDGYKMPDFDTFYGAFKPQEPQEIPVQQEGNSGATNFLGSINETILNIPADLAETYAIASAFTERQLGKLGVPGANPDITAKDIAIRNPVSGGKLPVYQAAEEYREKIKSITGVEEDFEGTFAGGVAQGLGQVTSMLMTGGGSSTQIAKTVLKNGSSIAPVVKAGKDLIKNIASPAGMIGGSMSASANYRQAIDDGATEEQALRYGIENFAVGSVLENIPVQGIFSRIAKAAPDAKILDVIKDGAVGFSEEFVTEGMQTTYENMSAQRIYDLNQEILEGVGNASAVGGTVGFIMSSMVSALTGRRARAPRQEQEIIDKSIEEINEKIELVDKNNEKVAETVNTLEKLEVVTLNDGATELDFIENPDGTIEFTKDGLDEVDAKTKKFALESKYPNMTFSVQNNTNQNDPYASGDFTVVGVPKAIEKSKAGSDLAKIAIDNASTLEELEAINVADNEVLQRAKEDKIKKLAPTEDVQIEESVDSTPKVIDMAGEPVSVKIGQSKVSGVLEVDEGGKATITQGGVVYEVPQDAEFTEFVRPVSISEEGDFVVNGDSFSEARVVVENGKSKALLIRQDGTTKAITNPRIVEEIDYQIALANLEKMTDQEADQTLKTYEQQRKTETTPEEGIVEDNETEDDRRLREATEEIQLIEDLALMELEDIESQAKLVEFTPPSMKEPKVYLVKKNQDGSYSASLNGRKVARPEITSELGKLFEQKTGEDISKLQEQNDKLKLEVEQKLFPNAKPISKQQPDKNKGAERQTPIKDVPAEPVDQGVDIEVPVEDNVVYHGTRGDFNGFDESAGIYFTPDQEYASHYSKKMPESGILTQGSTDDKSKIIKAKIGIKNPKMFGNKEDQTKPTVNNFYKLTPEKIAEYKKQGYDGLIFEVEGKPREQVVFSNSQIEILNEPKNEQPTEKKPAPVSKRQSTPKKIKGDSVEKIKEVAVKKKPFFAEIKEKFGFPVNATSKTVAKAYDEAKANNEKPEFIEAVDKAIATKYIPPATQKGKTPLAKRSLPDTHQKAISHSPGKGDSYDIASQWLLENRGGLLNKSIWKEAFGGNYPKAEMSKRVRMTRKGVDGGITISAAAEQIVNNHPEFSKLGLDETEIKSALIQVIKENESTDQVASRLNDKYDNSTQISKEEKLKIPQDKAISEKYTPEQWSKANYDEKAEYLNSFYELEQGEQVSPADLELLDRESIQADPSEIAEAYNSLDLMSDEELEAYANGYESLGPLEEYGSDRVIFEVFGETLTGIKSGKTITGDDGVQYDPSMVSNTKPEIQKQKEKVKAILADLKSQLNDPKAGISFDFEQKAKDDVHFFNTIKKLITEYARLKGLQFNEFIQDLQKMLGPISKENKTWLSNLWKEEKASIGKQNVMTENPQLSYKEQVKQGLEEILASRARLAQIRLDREIQKGREAVQKAKDQGVEKLEQFANRKKVMIEFIKMDLKDIPVSEFTKGEFARILGKINKANTDWTLNKSISEAYQIIGEAGVKKRLRDAESKRKLARANIKAGKIGQLEKNSNLDSMLKIAPKLIPQRVFDSYEQIINDLGARKKVLSPVEKSQLEAETAAIMKEVDNDNSRAQSLKVEYDNYQDKKETFGKTIDQMVKDDIIDQDDRDFMMARKSEIEEKEISAGSGMDQVSVDELISDTISAKTDLPKSGSLFTPEQNNIIRFFNSITKEDLQALLKQKEIDGEVLYDASYVKNVLGLIQNIKDGYIPHLAESTRQTVEANRTVATIKPIVAGYKGNWTEWVSGLKAAAKTRNQKGTSTLQEKLRRSPIYALDMMLGNFQSSAFYQNTFRKVGLSLSNKDSDTNKAVARIDSKLKKIPETEQWEQLSTIRMLQLQKQHESNPELPSVKQWLEATLTEDGVYFKNNEESLREIFDKNATDGELDVKKATKNLSPASKDLMAEITDIQDSELKPKVDFGATVVHGKRVPLPNDYTPTPIKYSPGSKAQAQEDVLRQKISSRSSKAGTFEEKTKVAHPISFDPIESFYWSLEETLTDFYMTPVIKELDQVMNTLYLSSEGKTKESARAIRNVYEETIKSILGAERLNYDQKAISQNWINFIEKKGYQAMLGGIVRPSIDLASNLTYAGLYKTDESILGMKAMVGGLKNPGMLAKAVKNIGTTELNRMYDTVGISNKFADSGKKEQRAPIRGKKNVVSTLLEKSKIAPALRGTYEAIDYLADQSVSTPDKVVSRMIFLGEFITQFKNSTGKDPDFQKIADNDQDYIEANYEAIKKASAEGDVQINEAFSSSNQAGGILRNNKKAATNGIAAWLSAWQGFMTKFTTGEYITALKAVNALRGNGEISRAKGARLLSAQMARISIYSFLIQKTAFMASNAVLGLLGFEDEEEREEKNTPENDLAQSVAQVIFTIAIQRNFGNWAKIPIDYFVEFVNSTFGEGITYSGEYNAFDDSIAFPIFDPSRDPNPRESDLEKFFIKTSGPISPLSKSVLDLRRNYKLHQSVKKPETKKKYEKRIWMNMMQVTGSMGGVPFYRDVNHAWKQELRKQERDEKTGKDTIKTKSKFDYR